MLILRRPTRGRPTLLKHIAQSDSGKRRQTTCKYNTSYMYIIIIIIIIKDICKKYTKCAKSAVKQKCLQSGFENVQRDVR